MFSLLLQTSSCHDMWTDRSALLDAMMCEWGTSSAFGETGVVLIIAFVGVMSIWKKTGGNFDLAASWLVLMSPFILPTVPGVVANVATRIITLVFAASLYGLVRRLK